MIYTNIATYLRDPKLVFETAFKITAKHCDIKLLA